MDNYYIGYNVLDEITYSLPNFTACTFKVWGMDTKFYPTLHNGCPYLSILGLKLTRLNKRDPLVPVLCSSYKLLELWFLERFQEISSAILNNDIDREITIQNNW